MDTFQKCAHTVEETFGQDEKVFKHEDGEDRSNKVLKEWMKFMKAFETIQSLPADPDVIKEDLEMSVADCVYNPTKYYDTWMKEAS